MTGGEYWILDVVLEWRDSIRALEPDDIEALEAAFNRKWHGLPHDELLDTLDSLFQRGDIIAGEFASDHDDAHTELYTLSRKDIEAELRRRLYKGRRRPPSCIYYGLTAQGGARWEAISRPDWNCYLNRYGNQDANGLDCQEMESSNKALIEAYLERELRLGRVLPRPSNGKNSRPGKPLTGRRFRMATAFNIAVLMALTA